MDGPCNLSPHPCDHAARLLFQRAANPSLIRPSFCIFASTRAEKFPLSSRCKKHLFCALLRARDDSANTASGTERVVHKYGTSVRVEGVSCYCTNRAVNAGTKSGSSWGSPWFRGRGSGSEEELVIDFDELLSGLSLRIEDSRVAHWLLVIGEYGARAL
jgi:hypothetical protein